MADLEVRVTPRSSRNKIAAQAGEVRAWLTAPPADGEANAALLEMLAKALAVPKSRLTLLRGATARRKLVRIEGLDLAEILARLPSEDDR